MELIFTPEQRDALTQVGYKFTAGGSHSSRTLMLTELKAVLDALPMGTDPEGYRSAVVKRNILGKGTESTRQKSIWPSQTG